MACNIKSYFNQGPSILGGKLYEIFKGDSKEADRTYNYFQSKAFTHGPDGFGNWMLGESKLETTVEYNNRLDDNGEPLLMLDEASGLHYYLDRNYNKRFYPVSRNKLEGLLSSNGINSITEALTMDLINEVIIKRAEGSDKNKGSDLDPSVFENLENFIEEHLSLYVEALDSSNDLSHMGYIMGVEESMDALSEWAQLVRDQLARNHGEIIDVTRTDIMDHASANTRSNPSWDTASY